MIQPWQRAVLAFAALGVASGALLLVVYSDSLAEEVLGEENLVYYWSPTELEQRKDKATNATIRLGGLVKRGPGEDWDRQLPLRFSITDAEHAIPVVATGAPPQMFREGIGVVVEGKLAEDGTFHTDRVMVKHSNEYRAPEEGESANQAAMTLMPE